MLSTTELALTSNSFRSNGAKENDRVEESKVGTDDFAGMVNVERYVEDDYNSMGLKRSGQRVENVERTVKELEGFLKGLVEGCLNIDRDPSLPRPEILFAAIQIR